MKGRNPKAEGRKKSEPRNGHRTHAFRPSDFGFRIYFLCFGLILAVGAVLAQTNGVPDQIPPLRPPRAPMPPTFWDRNGGWVLFAGAAVLLIAAGGVWLLTGPKPALVAPPETQARQELALLLNQPEDGKVLSRVSQILRRYVACAFDLPPGEMTTADFCRTIAAEQRLGTALPLALAGFLRECDERKFAQPRPMPALGAAAQALKLIETAEARREELRRAAQSTPPAANSAAGLKT